MTVIAGLETRKGTVLLGADSCSSTEDTKWSAVQPKVFKAGEFAIGFSGCWRLGQILRYQFVPPSLADVQNDEDSVMGMMINVFVPRLQRVLDSAGYIFKQGEDAGEMHGRAMIGVCGRLFTMQNDFSVTHSAEGYDAQGTGDALALGSLASSRGRSEDRVLWALEAAERHCPSVAGPFTFVEV